MSVLGWEQEDKAVALEPLSRQDGSTAAVAAGAEMVTAQPSLSVAARGLAPRWEVLVIMVWVKSSIPCTELLMGWW